MSLLTVKNLRTSFDTAAGRVQAVDGVDFELDAGDVLGIVGESGCGKSVTALSLMSLLPRPPATTSGEVVFDGQDLASMSEKQLREIRGSEIAMIFPDPMTSLNPLLTVGRQLIEVLTTHLGLDKPAARRRAIELLTQVGIPAAHARIDDYPHQFSGGMQQRAMIAMALSCDPRLVIADEITTALDVTIQAQVLDLFARLTRERGTAVLIITHDMGVVAEMTSRVLVMYGGQIVERCSTETLFGNPRMPYTWGLIDSVLRMDGDRRTRLRSIEGLPPTLDPPPPGCRFAARCAYRRDICSEQDPALLPLRAGDHSHEVRCWGAHDIEGGGWLRESTFGLATDVPVVVSPISARPASHSSSHDHRAAAPLGNAVAGGALLTVRKLTVDFPLGGASLLTRRRSVLRAVDGVELTLHRGRTLGIVGESGCGKSTLARAILRLQDPTDGSICFDGIELTTLTGRAMRRLRRRMQMIPQDPHRSLDPRRTVGDAVSEAIQTHHMAERSEVADRVAQLLVGVGLDTSFLERYPHQLSGGQRQRVGIARALAVEPELIVADEPVSTLDVSVQAQIINLMRDVQTNFGLSLIFIAHDLAVVRHISDEVAVMYLGRVIEFGDAAAIFGDPRHPYTRALMSAVPLPYSVGRRRTPRIILDGELPSPASIPAGCRFRTRCKLYERLGGPAECADRDPTLVERSSTHTVACHFHDHEDDGPSISLGSGTRSV